MSLNVNAGNGGNNNFAPVSEGVHTARCYQIIDLGHQTTEYQGTVKVLPKVRITWEICDEQMTDGRPFSISKEYTASIGIKATLRKDLEAWRARKFTDAELANFSLENVLGKPCMISVVHKPSKDGTQTYANVGNVMALPKGLDCPPQHNPSVKFDINEFDHEVFESLPEWLRTKILMAKELEDRDITQQASKVSETQDDSVPF